MVGTHCQPPCHQAESWESWLRFSKGRQQSSQDPYHCPVCCQAGLGGCHPVWDFIAYDIIKGASSHLFYISKCIFLIKQTTFFFLSETSPSLREHHWRVGSQNSWQHCCPETKPQRSRHRLGLHTPSQWSVTPQSGSSGQGLLAPQDARWWA